MGKMKLTLKLGGALLIFAALSGCYPKGKDESKTASEGGELGNGTFTYACGPLSDAFCVVDADKPAASADQSVPFPVVATGSRFTMTYKSDEPPASPFWVTVLAPEFFTATEEGKYLIARLHGFAALGGPEGDGGLEDLTHLEIADPVALRFSQEDTSGNINGSFGGLDVAVSSALHRFRVAPVDAADGLLAGALPCSWTTSDASVVAITTDVASNVIEVSFGKAGTATLGATLGDLSGEVQVTVKP
ncbi:MAG: hypothetical protein EXR75_12595 [Myxococcales bacterium]|nr:hypothetical protein [Myxococcales bacterium]